MKNTSTPAPGESAAPSCSALLPCPFCGNATPELVETHRDHWRVGCAKCGSYNNNSIGKDRAVKQWNCRGSEPLEWLNSECFDLRCESVPTGGGDDADIIWIVYSHHMAKPVLRAEGYGKTASAAIRDAMLPKGDPMRWDYVPEDTQNSAVIRTDPHS